MSWTPTDDGLGAAGSGVAYRLAMAESLAGHRVHHRSIGPRRVGAAGGGGVGGCPLDRDGGDRGGGVGSSGPDLGLLWRHRVLCRAWRLESGAPSRLEENP